MSDSINDIILKIQINKGESQADIKSVITDITNAAKQGNADITKQELDNITKVKTAKSDALTFLQMQLKQAVLEEKQLKEKQAQEERDLKAKLKNLDKADQLALLEEIRIKNFNNNLELAAARKSIRDKQRAEELAAAEEIKLKNKMNDLEVAYAKKQLRDKERAEEKQARDDAKKDEIQDLTNALQSGTAALGAFYAALKLIATDNAFIQASSQYEVNLRNFNAVALQTEEQLKQTHEALKALATDEQLSGMTELAKALRSIQTAGFSGAEGLTVLAAANRGAKSDLSDLTGVAKTTTSILNSYSLSAEHAADIININSKAIKLGKLTYDELNTSIGTAISLSAEAGVEYAQVAAAMATIHKQGVSAHISATEVNAVLKAAFHSGADSIEFAKSLGIELSSASIQLKGVGGFVKDIFDKTAKFGADQQSAIARLIPDIRSLRGLEKLVNDEGRTFNDILAEMKDGSDQTGKALEEQKKTFQYLADQIGISSETIKIEMGDLAQGTLKPFLKLLNELMTGFINLPEGIRKVIETITLLGISAVGLTIGIGGLILASKALGISATETTATMVFLSGVFETLTADITLMGIAFKAETAYNYLMGLSIKSLSADFLLLEIAMAPFLILLAALGGLIWTLDAGAKSWDAVAQAVEDNTRNIKDYADALSNINKLEKERNELRKEGKDLSYEELKILQHSYAIAAIQADPAHRAEYKERIKDLQSFIDNEKEKTEVTLEEQNRQNDLKKAGITNLDKYEKEIYNASHTERENAIRKANEEFAKAQEELQAILNATVEKGSKKQLEEKKRATEDLTAITQANADEIDKINAKYDEIERKRRITATNEYISQLKTITNAEITRHEQVIQNINDEADARELSLKTRATAINSEKDKEKKELKKEDFTLSKQEQTDPIKKRRTDIANEIIAIEKFQSKKLREIKSEDTRLAIAYIDELFQAEKDDLSARVILEHLTAKQILDEDNEIAKRRIHNLNEILGTHKEVVDKIKLQEDKANKEKQLKSVNSLFDYYKDPESVKKLIDMQKQLAEELNAIDIQLSGSDDKEVDNFKVSIAERTKLEKELQKVKSDNRIENIKFDEQEFQRNTALLNQEIDADLAHQKALTDSKTKSETDLYNATVAAVKARIIVKDNEIAHEKDLYKNNELVNQKKALEDSLVTMAKEQSDKIRAIEDSSIEYREKRLRDHEEAILAQKQKTSNILKEIYKLDEEYYLKHASIIEKIMTKQTEIDSYNIPNPSGKGTFVPKVDIVAQKQAVKDLEGLYKELGSEVINVVNFIGSSVSKVNKDIGGVITGFTSIIKAAEQGPIAAIIAAAAFVFDKIMEAVEFDKKELAKFQDAYYELNRARLESARQTTGELIKLAELEHQHNMDIIERNSWGNNQYRTEQLAEEQKFQNKMEQIDRDAMQKRADIAKGLINEEVQLRFDYHKTLLSFEADSVDKSIALAKDDSAQKTNTARDALNKILNDEKSSDAAKEKAREEFKARLVIIERDEYRQIELIHEQFLEKDLGLQYEHDKAVIDSKVDSLDKTKELIEREKKFTLDILKAKYDAGLILLDEYNIRVEIANLKAIGDMAQAQIDYGTKIRDLNQKNYDLLLKIITSESEKRINTLKSEIAKEIDLIENKAKKIQEIEENRTITAEQKAARLASFNKAIAGANKTADFFRANPLDFDTGNGSTTGNETQRTNTQNAFDLGQIGYDEMRKQRQQEAIDKYLYYLNLSKEIDDPIEKQQAHEKAMSAEKEYYEFIFDSDKEKVEQDAKTAAKKLPDLKAQLSAEEKEYDRLVKTLDDKFRDSSGAMKDTYVSDFRSFVDNIQPDISKLGVDLYNALRGAMVKFKENDIAYDKLKAGATGSTGTGTVSKSKTTTSDSYTGDYSDADINKQKAADSAAQKKRNEPKTIIAKVPLPFGVTQVIWSDGSITVEGDNSSSGGSSKSLSKSISNTSSGDLNSKDPFAPVLPGARRGESYEEATARFKREDAAAQIGNMPSYAAGTPDTGDGGVVRVHPKEMILESKQVSNAIDLFKVLKSPPEHLMRMMQPKGSGSINNSSSASAYYDNRCYYVSGVTAAQEFKTMLKEHDANYKVKVWKQENGR